MAFRMSLLRYWEIFLSVFSTFFFHQKSKSDHNDDDYSLAVVNFPVVICGC